ncbi:MAG: hypothetical protein M3Z08_01600 [Chloroflexota bacterium]|nr:hypothetical protein [Chloroflexota bacterium]
MIWVTWRQHRTEALITGIVFIIIVVDLLISGMNLAAAYQQMGVASCLAHSANASCTQPISDFTSALNRIITSFGLPILAILPLLVGLFIGAPAVARELESGTYRLAWTQSITRFHWLVTKQALLMGAILLVFATLSVVMWWWNAPVNVSAGPWIMYDLQGLVPLAYSLFALVLGIVVGIIIRKTLPAMAITLAVFVLLRVLIELLLRPHLTPQLTITWAYNQSKAPPIASTSWIVEKGYIDSQGKMYATPHDLFPLCVKAGTTDRQAQVTMLASCVQQYHIRHFAAYQPVERFWLFQGIESAIFFALTIFFAVLALWWIRRKVI